MCLQFLKIDVNLKESSHLKIILSLMLRTCGVLSAYAALSLWSLNCKIPGTKVLEDYEII